MSHSRRLLSILGWLAAFVATAACWALLRKRIGDFPFDDTFITLRYAENLALHGHLSFNLDDRVDGYSSPLWTIVLAAIIRCDGNGEHAAISLSLVFGLLGVWGSGLLALRLGASRWAAFLVAMTGTCTMTGWAVWSAPGMETPLVGLCAVALLAVYADPASSPWLRCVCLIVTAAARPEGAVLVLGGLAAEAARLRASGSTERHRITVALATTTIVLVVGFAVHWMYYGHPLPNTFYAKLSGVHALRRGINDAGRFLVTHGVGFGAIGALILVARRSPATIAALMFLAWLGASLVAYASAGGDYMEFDRFYQPLVPACFAMSAAGLSGLFRRREDVRSSLASYGLYIVVAVLFVIDGQRTSKNVWGDNRGIAAAATYAKLWRGAAGALAANYPPSTSISIRAAGVIPYITRFRSFDTLGLNNAEVAAHPGIVRENDPGHSKEASISQVVAWRPDLIINHPMFRGTDETGKTPASTPSEIVAAGYQFACASINPRSWICFYERPGTQRLGTPAGDKGAHP